MHSPLELPLCYYDGSLVGLVYRPEVARTRLLLEHTPFAPIVFAGRAAALLLAFEYRSTTIGPYAEVGLAVQVKRRGTQPRVTGLINDLRSQPDQGLYMVHLPVTSRPAMHAGRRYWGYPKYLNRIYTNFCPDHLSVDLYGELRLSMGASSGIETAGFPFVTCTTRRGRVIRTVIETNHNVRWGGAQGAYLSVIGNGPTARSVLALGLDQMRPMAAFRTDALRAILPAGEDQGQTLMRPRLVG